ncbi:helix-turn-helix transcriptional regulator [Streptomyces sp. NPDC002668]|uniref:helix-turn-helix domain-containing protein n=1 Tax=Streptomyces sp. NPDC002668 TaxID=3154422 RepID=UPI00332F7B3B
MDAAPDAFPVNDLATAVVSIDELLRTLGLDRDVIDIDKISYETGIPVDRVHALLDGKELEPANLQESFQQRLVFLRETRLKPGGKRYTLDEIGTGAGISHAQAGYMLNGKRSPGLAVLASLERFFAVQPGFFTATDRQALHRALQPIHDQLTHLALLKGKGISDLAMRSGTTTTTGEDSKLGLELRAALTVALNQPEPEKDDPEVRELTDKMRSLPSKSRRRILPLIQGLLGLVRAEGDGAVGDSLTHGH